MDAAITDPADFWEQRYLSRRSEAGRMWSGQVNATVAREVAGLSPGSALDLGCGEGADALWLSARGWAVTAVDIAANALAVARQHAEIQDAARAGHHGRAGHDGRAGGIHWIQADLATWQPPAQFDLVSAAFLHSPVQFPREEVLRRAASAVAPGGQLLIVGHGAFPSQAMHTGHSHETVPLPGPDEVLAALRLTPGWAVETNTLVDRDIVGPEGHPLTLVDTVLRVRRPQ